MAKKAARKPSTPKRTRRAKSPKTGNAKSPASNSDGRVTDVNKSAKVRELKKKQPDLTASQIQKALADKGVAVSLPGIYQALRANDGATKKRDAKRKRTASIGKRARTSEFDHGAVGRFIHAVGELGVSASRNLLESIEKIMHLRDR